MVPSSATPVGANRNWPNEPAAVPAPSASPRRSGGSSFEKADSTRLKEQPDSPKPINTPAPRLERQRRRGVAHHQQARGIEQRADEHHTQDAEAIGDRAGKGLAEPPQQILHRQREAEHVAAPGEFAAHRLDEEA